MGIVEGHQTVDPTRRNPKKWNHFKINLKIYHLFRVLRLRKKGAIKPNPQKSKKVESLLNQLKNIPFILSFAVKKKRERGQVQPAVIQTAESPLDKNAVRLHRACEHRMNTE